MKILWAILLLLVSAPGDTRSGIYTRHRLIGLRLLYARVKVEMTGEMCLAPLY